MKYYGASGRCYYQHPCVAQLNKKLNDEQMKRNRGYFGIGVYHPKTTENIGTLWRSAHNFGADFIFTIGKRYKKQASDTTKAERHIPLYEYLTFIDFKEHLPKGCRIIFIEQVEGASNLKNIGHPQNCVYLLGAEDYGIPEPLMRGHQKVFIDTPMCLNVAVAGSIVMYDRLSKMTNDIQNNGASQGTMPKEQNDHKIKG